MPNQPDINKIVVAAQISLETNARLEKLAKERRQTKSRLIASILHEELRDVVLDAEDYIKIAEMVEARKSERRRL